MSPRDDDLLPPGLTCLEGAWLAIHVRNPDESPVARETTQ
jgi:hypothetical protein